jgi:N-acetylglutamate synthase-like GNAT family acetyltransferase
LTSGVNSIRKATPPDLDSIKQIADAHRQELGFIRRPTLQAAINRQEIFVADKDGQIIGFVEYHHRRDEQTTLYNIVVQPNCRGQGVGRGLAEALITEAKSLNKAFIRLKCPAELESNQFYEALNFQLHETEAGKHRPLNVWQFSLGSSKKINVPR